MYKYLFLISSLLLSVTFSYAFAATDTAAITESPLALHTASGNIYGTLAIPQIAGKVPVVLLIAGSGPTDRNGSNAYRKDNYLQQLAAQLAKNGIASLRYDKRGIGESKDAGKDEGKLRFDDYVQDAEQWIDLLRSERQFSSIVVAGHSEGSLIGMIAAKKADRFISIAGAGEPADKILKEQLSRQPKLVQDLSFPIIDSLKEGKQVDSVNPMLYSLFRSSVQPYLISWFAYDPQSEIKKLHIPILILQGTSDVHVSLEDAKKLNAASPKSQLVILDNMNHVLRKVSGDNQGNVNAQDNSDASIDEDLVKSIISFVPAK